MSSFRLICMAALTAALVVFVADAAAAQGGTATDRSGKPYLAGLRPPHDQHKPAQMKTSRIGAQHKATTQGPRTATKRQPVVASKSKAHRPAHLAQKINSRIAWPSVEPAAADAPPAAEMVLQFATEDTEPAPGPAPRVAVPGTATARSAPAAKIAATDERNEVGAAAEQPAAASTAVQTERFTAPASNQMRVILPASTEAPAAAPTVVDQPPANGRSSTAQMLATLAGAIAACIVGWLMIGFGSTTKIKATRI